MKRLPDPAKSRAVIVGVDRYDTLPDLPSVGNNVNRLAKVLGDPELWGLRRPDQCTVLLNPPSPDAVLDAVHDAAAEAEDALVVYFAGHGLVSPNGELYLALSNAHAQRLYRAVAYEDLRLQLVDTCTATSKVVILDCCYSGRALVGHMGTALDVANHAMVEGTYLMTASAETKLAWAPEGETYTAFTGELLKALEFGVPGASDPLEMETLFWHVRQELEAKSRPVPQQRARNAGHAIALVATVRWPHCQYHRPRLHPRRPRTFRSQNASLRLPHRVAPWTEASGRRRPTESHALGRSIPDRSSSTCCTGNREAELRGNTRARRNRRRAKTPRRGVGSRHPGHGSVGAG
ncbi:caspase domain-containing protein [Streptomyces sp. NPDC102259]|uniref:caspase family protein n=1 Tax=Streptomyces sp. NPDC102259 TaxID=3366148 RepID=UPI00382D51E4